MEIQQNIILAPYTTFHIGGPADYFVVVKTLDELKEAVAWAKKPSVGHDPAGQALGPFAYFLLGTGANILVSDKGYRGLVIKNEANLYEFSGNLLTSQSGATIEQLLRAALQESLSGLEDFAGIVSTVGGALWQNLHFLNSQRSETSYIANIVDSATILHEDGSTEIVGKDYFQFGYDQSILHTSKDIVLSATFRLRPSTKEEIQKVIDANLSWRKQKHPPLVPGSYSAGSVFKKIEGFGAGRLIEQVGLKGKQIGGASVSNIHANFIINTGNATAQNVLDLIHLIRQTVKQERNLDLEPEISFVGEF